MAMSLAAEEWGMARAMAEVHRREVIHRDLTPANVVVAADGMPTLVDFALATSIAEIRPEFTHHSEIPGTLAYLAPEQTGRTGRAVDQRADLYALGAVLYELGTGEPPFGGQSRRSKPQRGRTAEPLQRAAGSRTCRRGAPNLRAFSYVAHSPSVTSGLNAFVSARSM
jgi:serine/threonine protein kinase